MKSWQASKNDVFPLREGRGEATSPGHRPINRNSVALQPLQCSISTSIGHLNASTATPLFSTVAQQHSTGFAPQHLNATPLPFNWPKADQPSVGLFNAAGISTAAPLRSTVAPRQINMALSATCKRHRFILFCNFLWWAVCRLLSTLQRLHSNTSTLNHLVTRS